MSKSDNDVTVEVVAPRSTDIKKFTWPKSTLVGAAADEAAKAFGYEQGTPTFQTKDKRWTCRARRRWPRLVSTTSTG